MRNRSCLRHRIDVCGGFIDTRQMDGGWLATRWRVVELIAILDRLEDAILRVRGR
ncbi:MAG: hypothetical protein H0X45_03565 [Planctomycetes bacterium]|nr:hypothetical protein [Planctomycetota bacterium]